MWQCLKCSCFWSCSVASCMHTSKYHRVTLCHTLVRSFHSRFVTRKVSVANSQPVTEVQSSCCCSIDSSEKLWALILSEITKTLYFIWAQLQVIMKIKQQPKPMTLTWSWSIYIYDMNLRFQHKLKTRALWEYRRGGALINALILPSHGSKQIHGFMHWTCQCPVHYRQSHFKNIDYVPSHLWDVAVWVGVYLRVRVGVGVALAVNIVGCGWENCHRLSTAAINNTKCHVRASVRCHLWKMYIEFINSLSPGRF